MFTRAIYAPGPCQRPGCELTGNYKIKIDGELFEADPKRGLEAGFRLYGVCCADNLFKLAERFGPAPRERHQRPTWR